jgi:hypothetical protein
MLGIAEIILWSWTIWALASLDTSYKNLFGVIAAICGKKWMAVANHAITTCQLKPR